MKVDFSKIRFIVYAFFIFQLLSLLGYFYTQVSSLVFLIIVFSTIFIAFKRIEYGFLILIFEFFAGHGGHMFEFYGISLRTALFLIIICIWLFNKTQGKIQNIKLPDSPLLILFLILLIFVFAGFWNGISNNNPILAIKDFINYSYIFLVFPLVDVLKKNIFLKNAFNISKAGTIGICILTFIILIVFVLSAVSVHDPFYWWWRSVVVGKATLSADNFFRIVTPAHLLILPLFLVFLSFLIDKKVKLKAKWRKYLIWLAVLSSLALLINFSRAYLLGVLVGLIFLARKIPIKRWLFFSLIIVFIMVMEFGFIYAIVSGGQAIAGIDYFNQRMKSFFVPEQELSSLTRMIILPQVINKIGVNPVWGSGLGSVVSYIDPLKNELKTTFHIDWGYLEIWLELGIFALMIYFSIFAYVFYIGWQKTKKSQDILQKRLIIGLLAGLASIFVCTLTGPFLFHPLGIFYLTFVCALISSDLNSKYV